MTTKTKSKPSPPPANPQISSLEDLFSSLHRYVQNFEYEQAVKVADQVLAVAHGDEDALRCKIVALIKSDAIDKALAAIQASEGLRDLKFYQAYCLYRQNKLQQALDSLNNQEKTPMALQLESQILYRLGRMEACMHTYEKLQKFKIDTLDLKTNIVAALISAGRSSEVHAIMDSLKVKSSSSFELAYNSACSLIEKKLYVEAEQQLLSARRIGQEMLMDEDYADDEIETELAPISVQLAYIQQLLGNKKEAIEAYIGIINRNLADASSLAIATNNLIALRGTQDVSDSLRKLDRFIEKADGSKIFKLASGLDFKLSQRQKESLWSNRVLVLLQANRNDQAQELVTALPSMFPDSFIPILLQAAVLVKEKKIPKAEEILAQFADKFPEKSKPILLARAQIAAAAGHLQIATESLSMVHDIRHMPATVATVVSLKERVSDFTGAASALNSALQWWKDSMVEDNKLNVIMPETASFMLIHGNEEEAFQLYEELVKNHGSTEALVGLVKAAARTDLAKAEFYEKRLAELPGLKGINVESLEKTSGAKHVEGVTVGKKEDFEEVKKAKIKKRKRKPRYPKGFDPANPGPPPDPERWLPKRERSSFRPKRKDKRSQVRGSQGAVVREKHDSSVSNTANISTVRANTKPSQVSTSSKGAAGSEQPKVSSKSRKKNRS